MLSGCAFAQAEKPVSAFFSVNQYHIRLTLACPQLDQPARTGLG